MLWESPPPDVDMGLGHCSLTSPAQEACSGGTRGEELDSARAQPTADSVICFPFQPSPAPWGLIDRDPRLSKHCIYLPQNLDSSKGPTPQAAFCSGSISALRLLFLHVGPRV